ncbi:MAG: hypothetical protein BGO98_29055 [Myxococcales bacterium 68-20]|nr:hypothetical protein [Myxococcales bacterium]OJY30818.1 MAG: hypothetical protein BGO98_29055 [Myxococcales bacterium 68-20]
MARPHAVCHTASGFARPAAWQPNAGLAIMLRPRSSFILPISTFVLAALAFGGCAEGEPRALLAADAGTTTTEEPTDPIPDIGDTQKPKDPDEASAPEVDSISPNEATVGSVGPSIIVSGNNFVPRSIVQLDGAPLATSFVSGTELRATIPTGKLVTVSTLRVSVGTAPPGGGASKEVTFAVVNPEPQLIALSPLSVLAGTDSTQLEVSGVDFVQGAKIVFGMTDLATTFVSSSKLTGTIPSGLLATSGSVPVTVVSPSPGGGTSPSISFTISNPSASIQNINPSAAFVGSAAFEMTVNGGGFVSGSSVVFNGASLPTTYLGPSKLKAQVPASSLTAAGDFPIAVQNPPPGGGLSTPVVFKVQYPAPSATSVAPNTVAAGSSPREIVVTGVGFFVTSQITVDNAPVATTFVDSTHVKAMLSAAQLASAASLSVRVVNPAPGGGTSAALPFTVANGVPSITSLNPSAVVAGSADTVVTIYGSGFVSTSSVKSNGQAVVSTYVSGSQLKATVPSNHLLNPGSAVITVTTPAPGGGTSQGASLTIGCDTTGVNFALGAIGTTTTLGTRFDADGLMSRWAEAGSCTTAPLYTDVLQPGRYAVVQNTAGVPVTLSAWADCSTIANGDAFLTFYRRPTIPANDDDRLGCAFVVAEGTNSAGGYASPESNGSGFCPGLTKANGGGLQLGVCEKAVVHIQPYDYKNASFPAPPRIRLRPE